MEIKNNLEEEIFCLKYELAALSASVFQNKAERWINGFIGVVTEKEHLDRYLFAKNLVEGKRVLDMACGSGLGSFLLATKGNAKEVIGVDLDADSIRYGKYRYPATNVSRIAADATTFKDDGLFDVIISFETIEHISNFEDFLENVSSNLKKDGTLIISTPTNEKTTDKVPNPYHVIEWSFKDFHQLIKKHNFNIQEIYVQNLILKNDIEKKNVGLLDKIKFKLRPDLERQFYKKIEKQSISYGKDFEKFENQYNIDTIINGYQILIAKKTKLS